MRVLVAPDSFGDTLTAPEAARAIEEGWRRHAPEDVLTAAPMADGGPGFVDVLHEALGGQLQVETVVGPYGDQVPVTWLLHEGSGYIESAQACGLQLSDRRAPTVASSVGVGQVVGAALDAGVRRVVIGLGGSATNDGGAGLLSALGATANVPLDRGPIALEGITSLDLEPARDRCAGREIVIASDVDSSLLGMFGATKTFGPQKGLDDEQIIAVDRLLDDLVVAACGSTPAERRIADAKGAGAAGGLGFALMLLGGPGAVTSGINLVASAVGLSQQATQHDLVVSGEGRYDFSSRAGKVVFGVAAAAAQAARPCIVLAGQVEVGAREMRAMGVESAYAAADLVGLERSMSDPYGALVELAARVARTWSTT
ncbi:glycerate kinase family protein [Aeromicrobium sp. CF3.5]|uniref:glycerate kinase family protein n=1 Tax=Aeromicrobium sp. CF3.5 TaxID=3373078 RepID=UPI003EE4E7FD